MRIFKHSPHPVDMSDFMTGKNVVLGGRDFEEEERHFTELSRDRDYFAGNILSSITNPIGKIRRSVSDKLFTMTLDKITL